MTSLINFQHVETEMFRFNVINKLQHILMIIFFTVEIQNHIQI